MWPMWKEFFREARFEASCDVSSPKRRFLKNPTILQEAQRPKGIKDCWNRHSSDSYWLSHSSWHLLHDERGNALNNWVENLFSKYWKVLEISVNKKFSCTFGFFYWVGWLFNSGVGKLMALPGDWTHNLRSWCSVRCPWPLNHGIFTFKKDMKNIKKVYFIVATSYSK